MHYRFLIIHNATVIQKIIHKFLIKMYDSKATVDLCLPEDRALKNIAEKKYHIVYSGLEMSGLNGFDIHEQLHISTLNAKTPLIILTASDSPRQLDRFKHRGIKYYLNIPCSFEQFHNITHVALNPDIPDKHMRFYIPRTRTDIQIGEKTYKANVTNIGMESMDCELLCPEETAELIRNCGINISFPERYSNETIQDIKGSLLRMSIKERLTSTMPQRLRTTWKFSFENEDDQSGLAKIINKAPKNSLDMYEDLDNIYEINEKLTQNNESLQNELKGLQNENDRLLNETRIPSQDTKEIQENLDKIYKINEKLSQNNESLQNDILNLQKENEHLLHEISNTPEIKKGEQNDSNKIYELNEELSQENESLQKDLEKLQQEKNRLIKKIQDMEKDLSNMQRPGLFELKNISLSSLINEKAKAAKDPAKLEIFQRVIDDNIKIRKKTN